MSQIEIRVGESSVTAGLFNSDEFSDMKFIMSNGVDLFVHKNILSIHSPVFKAQFKSNMNDSNGVVKIEEEPEPFVLFIELLYKLRVVCHPKMLIPIFKLVDKYQVEKFKESLYKLMYFDRENVLVYFATTFYDEQNQYFLYLIANDFVKLCDNPHFLTLTKEMLQVILNIDIVGNFQLKAFQTLIKWTEKDKNRLKDFEELVSLIDFSKIDYNFIFETFQNCKTLKLSSTWRDIVFSCSLWQLEQVGKIKIRDDTLRTKTTRKPFKITFLQPILFGDHSKTLVHHTNTWKTSLGTEIRFGIHTWVLKFSNCDIWDGVIVGVARSDHKSDTHLGSQTGWGYYSGGGRLFNSIATEKSFGEPFTQHDQITVILNLDKGTIAFKKNDRDQGVFFSNVIAPVCVAVSSNNKCTFDIL